jgi:hypothetical protein
MTSFQTVRARAGQRKGGADSGKALLPPKHDAAALAVVFDVRVLAELSSASSPMTDAVISSAAQAQAKAVE